MSILQTINLTKHYGKEGNLTKALDGISLRVEQGEFVSIVGTSGSGKSTLLNMMGGLDYPTAGQVIVDGIDLSQLSDDKLTVFRRRNIGFVFQHFNLVPTLNVFENIVLPLQLDGAKYDKAYIKEIIHLLHLEGKEENLPGALSGGQQQRVALGRALATKPAIILADEPTGNLDSKTSFDVMGLLKLSAQRFGQTIVMITHNDELAQMTDRIVRIEDGIIKQRKAPLSHAVKGEW
ncbi:ABC transporter ATP-binding protein [Vagococcus sp. BWB3-3]|uniref:ABC transporter ATP-binding protein n=1 Tax=Vagococcus allomyrinae TaxID=2794353 RepID=A0A940PAA3_9ENTE|nr:ABC transporter ATP-binding protein [Vagococcus allomyrinae]MBP1040338.1 ABC transporter ATP-binding protein [Vagococcus allomyrinae]